RCCHLQDIHSFPTRRSSDLYNELEGSETPSKYKNMTFSVAVSWIEKGVVELEIFPNFKEMFDQIIEVYGKSKKIPAIKLNAHNTDRKSTRLNSSHVSISYAV